MITGFANKFGYQPTLAQHIYNQNIIKNWHCSIDRDILKAGISLCLALVAPLNSVN